MSLACWLPTSSTVRDPVQILVDDTCQGGPGGLAKHGWCAQGQRATIIAAEPSSSWERRGFIMASPRTPPLAGRALSARALLCLAWLAVAFAEPGQHNVSEASDRPKARKPHIVIVLGDDSGWYNFGWHNPDMVTPVMDGLVKSGIQLDRHYTFCFCSPTRSALMSGRLPIHVSVPATAAHNRGLPFDPPSGGASVTNATVSGLREPGGYSLQHCAVETERLAPASPRLAPAIPCKPPQGSHLFNARFLGTPGESAEQGRVGLEQAGRPPFHDNAAGKAQGCRIPIAPGWYSH